MNAPLREKHLSPCLQASSLGDAFPRCSEFRPSCNAVQINREGLTWAGTRISARGDSLAEAIAQSESQFAALKKHRREQIYDLSGNHDRSGLDESEPPKRAGRPAKPIPIRKIPILGACNDLCLLDFFEVLSC